jgi:spermidine/putrescine ABC transporter ATP-binding subunit
VTTDLLLAVRNVTRTFGRTVAVDDVSIAVGEGEFVSLLGPSGCGKTTLLRIIAGFEHPDSGTVTLAGKDITRLPPNRRPTNLLFQRGALFPHLTVGENIAYPLNRRRLPKQEVRTRVEQMLELIRLPDFADRRPSQLSGGEAQRIALARALAADPDVLLLDEPLGALDKKLRKELQLELRTLHRDLGKTFVFVTHDQEEALVMSDRIVVMNKGRVIQDGTPRDVYSNPSSVFASDFIGETNLLHATAEGTTQYGTHARVGNVVLRVPSATGIQAGAELTLSIRPEDVVIASNSEAENTFDGSVSEVVFLGNRIRARVTSRLGSDLWIEQGLTQSAEEGLQEGHPISLRLPAKAIRVFRAPADEASDGRGAVDS